MTEFVEQYQKLREIASRLLHNNDILHRIIVDQENVLVQRKIVEDLIHSLGKNFDKTEKKISKSQQESPDEENENKKSYEELERENKELKKELFYMNHEFSTLQQVSQSYIDEKERMEQRINDLISERDEIQKQAEEQINTLKEEHSSILKKYKMSISESQEKEKEFKKIIDEK
jgi:chromosome segregation ATPase